MRTADAVLATMLALAATPVAAHPHAFIDGGVDFLFSANGDLEALRVIWIYDPLTTLFLLEDLALSPASDETLSADDRARLAASQTEWQPGFEGDSYLWNGDEAIALSGPEQATARLHEGRAEITFLRRLARPFRPGPDDTTMVKVYDPEYFTAYAVTSDPALDGTSAGCAATTVPFSPDASVMSLLDSLSTISVDETPEGAPGAMLADRIYLSCN